jgi:hypothetical protein
MNKVEELLKPKAITRKGVVLFSKTNAKEFIKLCHTEMINIIGIDCFEVGDNWVHQDKENCIDYSAIPDGADLYDTLLNFIISRDNKFYFEIVCED